MHWPIVTRLSESFAWGGRQLRWRTMARLTSDASKRKQSGGLSDILSWMFALPQLKDTQIVGGAVEMQAKPEPIDSIRSRYYGARKRISHGSLMSSLRLPDILNKALEHRLVPRDVKGLLVIRSSFYSKYATPSTQLPRNLAPVRPFVSRPRPEPRRCHAKD